MSEKKKEDNNRLSGYEKALYDRLQKGEPVLPDNRFSAAGGDRHKVENHPPHEPLDIPSSKKKLAKKPLIMTKQGEPNPNPPRECGDIS